MGREELSEVEADLRGGIDRGELLLHYQPIVNLANGRITGVEALVRWQHPRHGLLPPSGFIPGAERTGLIRSLGGWVLQEACRQAMQWRRSNVIPAQFVVSVNLSAQQFQRQETFGEVARTLGDSGLAPENLQLEITESTVMQSTDATAETLRRLRELGIRLAIDDFGTGYSSLSYLHRFPFDTLKIDQSFTSALAVDAGSGMIVQAVIRLAHALGITTTAEGIESEEQASRLLTLECDQGQGYYFSRPLTVQEATSYLLRDGSES